MITCIFFFQFVESPTQAAETNAKLYGIELQRLGALVPLNKEYTEFAIPEFNSDWKTVAVSSYVSFSCYEMLLFSLALRVSSRNLQMI